MGYFKKYLNLSSAIIPSVPNRIGGLDELRGIAVLWVMISHGAGLASWLPKWVGGIGIHGVILFFMISGFIITKILLDISADKSNLSVFYVRRVFRIWPLMLLMLLISLMLDPSKKDLLWPNLLLINNFTMALGWDVPFRTDVMWSLAIEEQFYLFWPLIVCLCNRRTLIVLCQIGIVIGFAYDSGIIGLNYPIVQKTTHANMQYILIGCLTSILQLDQKFKVNFKQLLAPILLSLILILISYSKFDHVHMRSYLNWYGLTFFLVTLFLWTIFNPRLIKLRPLAYMGKLCYGLYLIHFFVIALVFRLGVPKWSYFYLYFVISIFLAHLSFNIFEMPFNGIRTRFEKNDKLFKMLCLVILGVLFFSIVSFISTFKLQV